MKEIEAVAEVASVEVEFEAKKVIVEPIAKVEDVIAVETPQIYWDLTDPYHKYTYDKYIRGNK